MVSPEQIHVEIAARIRKRATRKGLTMTALAAEAQVSRGHVWKILNGASSPTVAVLCRISAALDCHVRELLPPRPRKGR